MAISLIRQSGAVSGTILTITGAANGNVLILFFASFGTSMNAISTISCTNVTWSSLGGALNGTSLDYEIWKGVVSGGTSGTTVTITQTGSGSFFNVSNIAEFSGVSTVNDTTGVTKTGTSTSPSLNTYSTSTAGDLLLCGVGYHNGTVPSVLPGGSWNNLTFVNNGAQTGNQGEYNLNGASGSQTATWTISNVAWVTVVAALKPIATFDWGSTIYQPSIHYRHDIVTV